VTAIALVIAIGTGLTAGLGSIGSWRVTSLDASTELLHAHDLRVTLTEGSFVPAGSLVAAARGVPHAGAIEVIEERLQAESQLDASDASRTVLVPGRIVGVDVADDGPHVDRIHVAEGRDLGGTDDGQAVGVLEREFAEYHDLGPGDEVRVAGGKGLRIVGTGSTPDTFYVVPPAQTFGTPGTYGILFVPLGTAQALLGRPGSVNELVLTLAPGADPEVVGSELERAVGSALPDVGASVFTRSDETLQRIYEDASNDQQLMSVLALFVLLGASLAAFNLIGRVVEAQRRQIGVGMALGVPATRLALRPMLLAAEVALLGVVLGVGVGLLVGWAYGYALAAFLPLPVIETPLQPGVFLRGAAVGFVLPFAAAVLPVWRGVRMRPVDAIETGYRAAAGGGLAPLVRRVPLPGGTFAEMPLRDTLRSPRRTLMTVVGLAAVVAVIVTFLGMIDSFYAGIDRAEAEALRGDPARMTVQLDRPYETSGPEVAAIVSAPEVGASEATLRLPGAVAADGRTVDVWVELLRPGSELWQPSVSAGSFEPGTKGILITEKAAEDLGVGVGDEITLRHPRRTGPATFELAESPVEVVGLDPNPLRFFAYMDPGQAELMGLAGTTNFLSVAPAAGQSQDDVTRALFDLPGVASVEPVAAGASALRDYLDEFTIVIQVAALALMVLALLIAFNSTAINAEERARERATMFAFGLPVRTVLWMSIVESLLKGALATLLGIFAGLALIGWVFYAFLPEVLPEFGATITLSRTTYAGAVLVGVVATAVAPLLTVRRLRRMDVPSTLRVIE
jgi:putative ABC transport system permease protein